MRVVVLNIYLCLLVLCGGCAIYAANNHNHYSYNRDHAKRQHVKQVNPDHGSSILEDAEIDLDEDYLKGHDADETGTNKLFVEKYSLVTKWYISFSSVSIAAYHDKNALVSTPICGDSSPLYITQRVLRI